MNQRHHGVGDGREGAGAQEFGAGGLEGGYLQGDQGAGGVPLVDGGEAALAGQGGGGLGVVQAVVGGYFGRVFHGGEVVGRKRLLFLKKKKQKDFYRFGLRGRRLAFRVGFVGCATLHPRHGVRLNWAASANLQKFFASFFQKRRIFL
jgi:hypothetical protein